MHIAIAGVISKKITQHPTGGTERSTYLLVEGLIKRGHDITLYCAKGSETSAHQVEICEAEEARGIESNVEYIYPYTLLEIRKIIDDSISKPFDIVHVNFLKTFLLSYFADQIPLPILHTIRRDFFNRPALAKVYEKIGIHDNEHFVLVSKKAYDLSLIKTRIHMVYNGIAINDFPFRSSDNGYFLWLSRIDSLKGINDAVKAAYKAEVPLRLLGAIDAVSNQEFFDQKVKPFISETITYEKPSTFGRNVELYQGARALLFPTKWEEPFGLVVGEAMSCGTPVIAYNRGAMSELIENGVTGYLVDPKKGVEGLIKAIRKINSLSKEAYSAMRKAARKRIEENFSIEKTVENYEKLYKEIIYKFRASCRPA